MIIVAKLKTISELRVSMCKVSREYCKFENMETFFVTKVAKIAKQVNINKESQFHRNNIVVKCQMIKFTHFNKLNTKLGL